MEIVDKKTSDLVINKRVTKKEIEVIAATQVKEQMAEGFLDPVEALVVFTKLKTYSEAMVDELQPHALNEMKEEKERGVLGSTVAKGNNAGKWEFSDDYITELEEELKAVKEKAKKSNAKDRIHITLAGEQVTISKGVKIEGGETVKVNL